MLCGHCTCMADLGESCSHIVALLFALEANTQCQRRTSCTSLPCDWLPPSFQNVQYSTLADIDFMTPQIKRKRSQSSEDCASCSSHTTKEVKRPSGAELDSLYNYGSVSSWSTCYLLPHYKIL